MNAMKTNETSEMKPNEIKNYAPNTPTNISTVQNKEVGDELASPKNPAFQFGVSTILGVVTIIALAAFAYYGVAR